MASNNNRKRSRVDTGEIGSSGTLVNYGVIYGEEYNLELMGRRKYAIYNEMRLGNSSISTSLEAVKLPIISAMYTIQPASDSPKDVDIAKKLEYNLFKHLDWRQVLREGLTYLDFGFSVLEEVYNPGEIEGQTMIILDKLGFRKQVTVQKWVLDNGDPGVTQMTTTGHTNQIPMDKLLLLSHKREGDNYEGVSVLRTVYANWFYVKTYYKIDAIGYERQALGVVDIEYPTNALPTTIAALETAARNIRANEQSFLSHPAGYKLQWMDMKAGTLKDPTNAIDHHVREIAKNLLEQFNEIGSKGSSGAYSSSKTQYELFILTVQAIAETFVEAFNRQVVKTWVDMNYNVTEYPELQVNKIGEDNMADIVTAVGALVTAGIITPTDEDEAYFRKKYDLPDLPDELKSQDRSKTPPVTAPDPLVEVKPEDVKPDTGEVKAARTSRQVNAQVSARDFPGLYESLDIETDDLGCIMLDTQTVDVLKFVDGGEADLVDSTDRHDHTMGAVAETEAHVTLLFGLLENGNTWKKQVDTVLTGWSIDSVKISEIGFFDLKDSYAIVAHIEETPELIDGHERLTLLPHVQTFSEYKPHMTLAYVQYDEAIAQKWVDALGPQYNGKALKAEGINYGDLPEDDEKSDTVTASAILENAKQIHQVLTDQLYGPSKAA